MGLIKTGLKAAVAVKTAHYVHERIERRQQTEWAATQGQRVRAMPSGAVPAEAASPTHLPTGPGMDRSSALSQLKDLGELKASGVLSEEEFSQQKALILGG
jgi:Short C-terminal domain